LNSKRLFNDLYLDAINKGSSKDQDIFDEDDTSSSISQPLEEV